MQIFIEIISLNTKQKLYARETQLSADGLLIGKSTDTHIQIDEAIISRNHCRIFTQNTKIFIEDLGSTNGSVYKQNKLAPNKPVEVEINSSIFLAKDIEIKISLKKDLQNTGANLIRKKLDQKSIVIIGRDSACDIMIDDITASRKHAEITKEKGKYYITDLSSTNGTYLNGKKITSKTVLNDDDQIIIGRTLLFLNEKPENLSDEIAIEANGISKVFRNGNTGMKDVSFDVQSGSMVAIMGPSGCGKSTVLKALAGYSPASSGEVKLFGLNLQKDYDYLKTAIGYVPQDDTIHQQLTVQQALFYSGKLRLENASDNDIQTKIELVLKRLNITHISNQLISEVSGGQRKRVCIAVELLTDPLLLFLDEPTSPLDPQTIDDFMEILKSLSKQGTTIILVTHKPEDLQFMDRVIFMAKGGTLAFDGKLSNAMHFFGADKVNQIYKKLSDSNHNPWSNGKKKSTFNKEQNKFKDIQRGSFFHQWNILSQRNFQTKINDKASSGWLLLQAPLIALLICFILPDITAALPFLISVCAIWFGCNNASKEIVLEQSIYLRERMYNMAIPPYVLSKFTFLAVLAALQSFMFILILKIWFSIGDPTVVNEEKLFLNNPASAFFWMFLVSMVASSMGLVLSAYSKNSEKVMTILPLLLIPQIIFSGAIAPFKNNLVEFLSYTVLARWANHGQQSIQERVVTMAFNSETGINANILIDSKQSLESNYAISDYSANFLSVRFDALVMLVMFIFFTILLIELLKAKDPFRR
jgi:ABC-type multidrug transport system ATPase subunit/pSer/pThr/pTyr-binding forkhead associated (FHA) protein